MENRDGVFRKPAAGGLSVPAFERSCGRGILFLQRPLLTDKSRRFLSSLAPVFFPNTDLDKEKAETIDFGRRVKRYVSLSTSLVFVCFVDGRNRVRRLFRTGRFRPSTFRRCQSAVLLTGSQNLIEEPVRDEAKNF